MYSGCGGDDEASNTGGTQSNAAKSDITPGTTLKLWVMPNSPAPKEDMDKALAAFTKDTGVKVDVEVVDWGVQLDRIRNAAVSGEGPDVTQAGTTQVPFFAALGGFEDMASRVDDVGGSGALRRRCVEDDAGRRPGRHVGRAVVHRGAVDLLPQGRPGEGRRRPGDRLQDWDDFRNTLQAIKDKVPGIQPFGTPGKKAFDLVHHVMPFVWDAGGAELSSDNSKSTINSPQAVTGRGVRRQPVQGRPGRPEPARA